MSEHQQVHQQLLSPSKKTKTKKSILPLPPQDRAEGEWGEPGSSTLLKWFPKCITGLTSQEADGEGEGEGEGVGEGEAPPEVSLEAPAEP